MESLVQITRYARGEYYEMIRLMDERKRASIMESQIPLRMLSKRVAENIVTGDAEPVPDCLTCGVCCAFALIVPVMLPDSARLKQYWDLWPDGGPEDVTIERVLARNSETGCCVHLGGTLKKEIACEIYADRPRVCHDFDAGSDRCHAYRRMYGLEPPLGEERIAEVMPKLETKPPPNLISDVLIDVGSTTHGIEVTAEGVKATERVWMRIRALVDEDETATHVIHEYDPAEETWFESEFLGLSLEEAARSVAERKGTGRQ